MPYLAARVVALVPDGGPDPGELTAALARAVGHDPAHGHRCDRDSDCPMVVCDSTVTDSLGRALWHGCCARPGGVSSPDPRLVAACVATPEVFEAASPEWFRPLVEAMAIRRMHLGWTREELAARAGIHASMVDKVEHLRILPPLKLLAICCAVLGLELSWSVRVPVVGILDQAARHGR